MPEMLTVLIPTRNRQAFLERLVSHWARRHFHYPIVIADSSDPEVLEQTATRVASLASGLSVSHLVVPARTPLLAKLRGACESVRTPYVAVGADDDVFVAEGLGRAVAFLDAHPDYSVAHGEALLFCLASGMAHGALGWVSRYPQRTVAHATAAQRLTDHLRSYAPTWYSVQRTRQYREHLAEAAPLELDHRFGELLLSCLSLIQGKANTLDGLYMVRQAHAGQDSAKGGERGDLFDWVAHPSWAVQYQRVRDCLVDALIRQDGIGVEQGRRVVKEAVWSYLVKGLMKKRQAPRAQRALGVGARLRGMAKRIPGLRRAWEAIRTRIPGDERRVTLAWLLRPGSAFHAEFMPIYQSITADGHR